MTLPKLNSLNATWHFMQFIGIKNKSGNVVVVQRYPNQTLIDAAANQ